MIDRPTLSGLFHVSQNHLELPASFGTYRKVLGQSFPLSFGFWFDFCFTGALQHILGNFGRGQLT